VAALHGVLRAEVGRVWVLGEISNFTRAASGHCYFTLKDDRAQIRAVLFRGYAQNVAFELENGLEVLAFADAAIYEPRGELQLVVRRLEPRGQGALQLAFEQLRSRLEAEGLFDEERKRAIPAAPRAIGVVASKHSAALRDVLQVSGRRFPQMPLRIVHSRVQGEGAEQEIARALADLARVPDVELILLVRGGGSLEDLWCFNSEVVARAIVTCSVPVVSGVGHEVDVTVADLAADLRAPTPSAAAEMVLPDREELLDRVQWAWGRLAGAMRAACERRAQRLDHRADALHARSPQVQLQLQHGTFQSAHKRLRRGMQATLQGAQQRYAQGGRALGVQRPSARVVAEHLRLEQLLRRLARTLRAEAERGEGQLAAQSGRLASLSPLAVPSSEPWGTTCAWTIRPWATP
jgi:exodeoxyribonuclease VII large subunit